MVRVWGAGVANERASDDRYDTEWTTVRYVRVGRNNKVWRELIIKASRVKLETISERKK